MLPPDAKKFKPGDWVRSTCDCQGCARRTIGQIITLHARRSESSGIVYSVAYVHWLFQGNDEHDPDYLELVHATEVPCPCDSK